MIDQALANAAVVARQVLGAVRPEQSWIVTVQPLDGIEPCGSAVPVVRPNDAGTMQHNAGSLADRGSATLDDHSFKEAA